jgi:formate hydrogenlyase subunit 6/NADH:ubiquinone oxidoreductase subunit I
MVLAKLKENKILFKQIDKNLFVTTAGIKFATMTIAYFKDALTKGRVYRIRNELKIDCDFYAAYCPENEKYYIIQKGGGKSPTIYFTLDEIEKFNDRFGLLLRG